MSNKSTFQGSSSISSVFYRMSPSIASGSRSFFSQFLMTSTILILLVAYLPCISSSPTPPTPAENADNNNNKLFMLDPIEYQTGLREDSSSLSSPVHDQPLWYAQPRTHANQFLALNDNDIIIPKWYTRYNSDDDTDDDVPSNILVNKRASFFNPGGYSAIKKRKQLAKPPMEVMNEIVNSIYLKR